jgi:hypothetical protein
VVVVLVVLGTLVVVVPEHFCGQITRAFQARLEFRLGREPSVLRASQTTTEILVDRRDNLPSWAPLSSKVVVVVPELSTLQKRVARAVDLLAQVPRWLLVPGWV